MAKLRPMQSPDPFVLQHEGLVQVHQALVVALGGVAAADADGLSLELLVPHALGAARFLLGHHEAESRVLFPGLRRHGRLRSADAAFLDAREREHHDLHALCERLLGAANGPHPVAREISALAREILDAFVPHVAEEEKGLSPDRLAAMIDPEGLAEIDRELTKLRAGRPRV